MKNLCVLVFSILLSTFSYGQSAKEMLAEIDGKWQLDDNGNVTIVKVIEVPELSSDEIYNRALDFFIYNYGSGNSVIQKEDKEAGVVIGKGVYSNVHIGVSLITTYVSAWHILRIDVKDGRARLIVTLTEYDKKIVGGDTPPSHSKMNIAQEYPINPKGRQKTVMTKAFYKSFLRANQSLDEIEKTVKEGSTSQSIENSDW